MAEIEKLLDHLGYATPLLYAATAYGLFAWLDANASDEAKAALARTMSRKVIEKEQIATALVEVFDRLYTYPLLRLRALSRSVLFTFVMSIVFLIEFPRFAGDPVWSFRWFLESTFLTGLLFAFAVNAITDYVSLFVLRPWLRLSGRRPIFALLTGALIGVVVAFVGAFLRALLFLPVVLPESDKVVSPHTNFSIGVVIVYLGFPALMVFGWLPLFALGILLIRLLNLMSTVAERARWFLKDGEKKPLVVIGYVAATFVFVASVVLQAVF